VKVYRIIKPDFVTPSFKPDEMKKHTLIHLLLLINLFAFAQPKNSSQHGKEFDQLLSTQFGAGHPGATVLIARKGQVIYKNAFGLANMELSSPMRVDNIFKIGSITKQFTAIAILQLWEQGKLSLQDEITRFIPDYPTQGNKITIENLLTHTSGIRDHTSIPDTVQRSKLDFTPIEMIDYFKNQPMRFAPGTRWEYSNSNYTLLGYIIEKITGKTYAEYLEENFFKPIGMIHSQYASDTKIIRGRVNGYVKTKDGFENAPYTSMTQPYAAGSILSTVGDLLKWNQAVISYKLVKKETLDRAWSRYKLRDGTLTNYGYGWRMGYIQGSPSIWHAGLVRGFITMAIYLPKEDVFVTVLTNSENNPIEEIVSKLAAIAIGNPYEYKAIAMDSVTLKSYEGVYENERGQQRIISVDGNKLYSRLNRAPKVEIKAYQKNKFFFDADPMLTIEFTRNNGSKVDQLVTKSRTAIDAWKKTDKPIPSDDGIKLDEKILEAYTGQYQVNPEFILTVTREGNRLFGQATGQEKFEIFAESDTKFFLKVNDALLEFVKDDSGKVTKVLLIQGARKTDARKIK
jgi:CubicO group peptidase (beta-lactamase class C family)